MLYAKTREVHVLNSLLAIYLSRRFLRLKFALGSYFQFTFKEFWTFTLDYKK